MNADTQCRYESLLALRSQCGSEDEFIRGVVSMQSFYIEQLEKLQAVIEAFAGDSKSELPRM